MIIISKMNVRLVIKWKYKHVIFTLKMSLLKNDVFENAEPKKPRSRPSSRSTNTGRTGRGSPKYDSSSRRTPTPRGSFVSIGRKQSVDLNNYKQSIRDKVKSINNEILKDKDNFDAWLQFEFPKDIPIQAHAAVWFKNELPEVKKRIKRILMKRDERKGGSRTSSNMNLQTIIIASLLLTLLGSSELHAAEQPTAVASDVDAMIEGFADQAYEDYIRKEEAASNSDLLLGTGEEDDNSKGGDDNSKGGDVTESGGAAAQGKNGGGGGVDAALKTNLNRTSNLKDQFVSSLDDMSIQTLSKEHRQDSQLFIYNMTQAFRSGVAANIGAGDSMVQMDTLAPFIASFFADFASHWVFKNDALLYLKVMSGDIESIGRIAKNITEMLEISIRTGFAESMTDAGLDNLVKTFDDVLMSKFRNKENLTSWAMSTPTESNIVKQMQESAKNYIISVVKANARAIAMEDLNDIMCVDTILSTLELEDSFAYFKELENVTLKARNTAKESLIATFKKNVDTYKSLIDERQYLNLMGRTAVDEMKEALFQKMKLISKALNSVLYQKIRNASVDLASNQATRFETFLRNRDRNDAGGGLHLPLDWLQEFAKYVTDTIGMVTTFVALGSVAIGSMLIYKKFPRRPPQIQTQLDPPHAGGRRRAGTPHRLTEIDYVKNRENRDVYTITNYPPGKSYNYILDNGTYKKISNLLYRGSRDWRVLKGSSGRVRVADVPRLGLQPKLIARIGTDGTYVPINDGANEGNE